MPMKASMVRPLLIAAILALVVIGGAVIYQSMQDSEPSRTTTTGTAAIGGPFTLVDHAGRTVTSEEFRGRPMLVFFGFTHCPDVCPLTLQNVSDALDMLGSKASRLAVVFIAVDSKRDTPARLKAFREAFDKRIVMLSGSEQQIRDVVKSYRVTVLIGEPDKNGNYTVDHSAYLYLMDKNGRFVTHFRHTVSAKELARLLNNYLK